MKTSIKRRDLSTKTTRVVHEGRGFQSSVYEIDWRPEGFSGRVVVKDFRRTPPAFRRFVAPFLVKRECRALQHLIGTPGVPQFLGRIDRLAFALEFIEGTPISTFGMGEIAPEVFPRIQTIIDEIHARGVAHGDLKRRSNLLLAPDGRVWIIDFAAAIVARGPISAKLMRLVAEVDDKSLPRLKKFVAPELLTDEDKWKLENPTKLERYARKLLGR